jgi:hypothetical protein
VRRDPEAVEQYQRPPRWPAQESASRDGGKGNGSLDMTPQTIILDSEQKRGRAIKILSQLPLEKPLKLTVELFRAKRSLSANRRLWALHELAASAVGCSAADMHEDMLCEHYGYHEVKMPSGVIKRVPLERSHDKDTKRFAKFMEFVENFYICNLGVWLE